MEARDGFEIVGYTPSATKRLPWPAKESMLGVGARPR
jgi:hypothetical protein